MDFYRLQTDKERRRRKSKTRFFAITTSFLGLILISLAIYAVSYSDIFKIKKISVSGISDISSEKLTADLKEFLVNNSKISAFLGSDNILSWIFNTKSFSEKWPQLAYLDVKKDFLKREINIEAAEREKFGLWCQLKEPTINDQQPTTERIKICFWFDKDGTVFLEAPMVETELLRRVEDFSGRDLKIGDAVLDKKFIVNLESIFSVLEQSGLKTKTISLTDIGLEEVIVDASVGRSPKIYFSLKFSPEFALAAISELKKSGKWAGLQYIDFRSENRAYYK